MEILANQQAPDRFAYRVPEACIALGIGRTSLYELVKNGELRLIRIAGRTLVPRAELERLVQIDTATEPRKSAA